MEFREHITFNKNSQEKIEKRICSFSLSKPNGKLKRSLDIFFLFLGNYGLQLFDPFKHQDRDKIFYFNGKFFRNKLRCEIKRIEC